MSEPMYSCSATINGCCCAEECSYPANMLAVYHGVIYCEGCWNEMPAMYSHEEDEESIGWSDLESFIPAHIATIAEQAATIERLRDAAQDVVLAIDEYGIGRCYAEAKDNLKLALNPTPTADEGIE